MTSWGEGGNSEEEKRSLGMYREIRRGEGIIVEGGKGKGMRETQIL